MYRITLHALSCFLTEDITYDEVKIKIYPDNQYLETNTFVMNDGWTKNIGLSYEFNNSIKIKLFEYDRLSSDDHLGTYVITGSEVHGALVLAFVQEKDAWYRAYDYEYLLTAIVTSNGQKPQDLATWSLRDNLGMMGIGVGDENEYEKIVQDYRLTSIHNESISFKENYLRHKPQDNNKSDSTSLREWIQVHCDFFSPYANRRNRPMVEDGWDMASGDTWRAVDNSEISRQLRGFVNQSYLIHLDHPANHETFDWNWDIVPDPSYCYMWGAGGNTLETAEAREGSIAHRYLPSIHNEWESGSMPVEWRPGRGQYTIMYGRHAWDTGHAPVKAEIHPPHTIVNISTGAASIGSKGEKVPVNRAVIGMGASGGFISQDDPTEKRWKAEHGYKIADLTGEAHDVYYTNLKKHGHSFPLYPPVPRPSKDAQLTFNVRLCQHISVEDSKIDSELIVFLNKLRQNSPSDKDERAHRLWGQLAGYPAQETPPQFHPDYELVTDINGIPNHLSVKVDIAEMQHIPVGYYAIVECGWNEPSANFEIDQYELELEALEITDAGNDGDGEWSYYFSVNGVTRAHWFERAFEGDNQLPVASRTFRFDVVRGQPLVVYCTGIDRDPTGDWIVPAQKVDRVSIDIPGGDIIQNTINHDKAEIIQVDEDGSVIFRVQGKSTDDTTKHSVRFNLRKTN